MTKVSNRLYELDILRVVACLSVVLLHSIKFEVGFDVVEGLSKMYAFLRTVSGILAYGTPTFIVISEVLLSKSYPNKLPEDFWIKRIKFLLLPYVSMALFYAIVTYYKNPSAIPLDFLYNLLGNYHGWFIIVIFQFYLLHSLFIKFANKFKMKNILIWSFVVNAVYMIYFNFSEPLLNNTLVVYWWSRGYWLPFMGWVFYFSLAFYMGKNYDLIMRNIKKFKWTIFSFVILSVCLVLTMNNIIPNLTYGSKRVDMLFLTFSVVFLVLYLAKNTKRITPLVDLLSRYSFGIYLMHWFAIRLVILIMSAIGVDLGILNIVVYLLSGVIGSITIVYIINSHKYGKFIVGNVKRNEFKEIKFKNKNK